MQIQTHRISPMQVILTPRGRVDIETSPILRQAILDLAGEGAKALVVDLGQVDFMDSSGLSALVSGMKALRREGGLLGICNAHPQVRTALRLTMLDRVFPVHASLEAALKAISADPETGLDGV